MPRAPKKAVIETPKGPTEAERSALAVLLYDSCLFQAHGVIVHNVREGVSALLRTLGREDLATLWEDPDEQFSQFGRAQ